MRRNTLIIILDSTGSMSDTRNVPNAGTKTNPNRYAEDASNQ